MLTEPRLRGDGPLLYHSVQRKRLRTPPTRGWPRIGTIVDLYFLQNPAYAGMALRSPRLPPCSSAEPRLRGDGPLKCSSSLASRARTPPTRGWPLQEVNTYGQNIQNPAYAGMALERGLIDADLGAEPRLRGDGSSTFLVFPFFETLNVSFQFFPGHSVAAESS